jgi:hypothetical protein
MDLVSWDIVLCDPGRQLTIDYLSVKQFAL